MFFGQSHTTVIYTYKGMKQFIFDYSVPANTQKHLKILKNITSFEKPAKKPTVKFNES